MSFLDHLTKVCTKCGEEKPFSQFSRHRTTHGMDFVAQCKACKAAATRKYQHRKKEKPDGLS